MTDPANEHLQKQTLTVQVYVPDHPDRTATPIFAATRRKLIENNPAACCYICGTRDALELHHYWVEWCDSTAVDWGKVRQLVPSFDWNTFDPTKPEMFIDSDPTSAPGKIKYSPINALRAEKSFRHHRFEG